MDKFVHTGILVDIQGENFNGTVLAEVKTCHKELQKEYYVYNYLVVYLEIVRVIQTKSGEMEFAKLNQLLKDGAHAVHTIGKVEKSVLRIYETQWVNIGYDM